MVFDLFLKVIVEIGDDLDAGVTVFRRVLFDVAAIAARVVTGRAAELPAQTTKPKLELQHVLAHINSSS